MKHYIGIDLGTTNSAICSYDGVETRIWKSPEQNDVTPSAIFIDRRGNKYVGKRAYDMAERNPDQAATLFKRLMGTSSPVRIGQETWSPEQCSAEVLKTLFGYLPEEIRQAADTGTVITVPAAFNLMQKEATLQAAQMAGIGAVALMQEPVAAAMSAMQARAKDGIFLIYDLDGTLDVAVAEIMGGHVTLHAQGGIAMCGGRDFDRALVDNVVRPWLREAFDLPADLVSQPRYTKLLRMATWATERAKIELSTRENAVINLTEDELQTTDQSGEEIYLEVPLSRAHFDPLIAEHIQGSISEARRVLEKAGLTPDFVDQIIFVGNETHYKPLRDMVCHELAIAGNTDVNPMTAVAEGASLFAESVDWSTHNRERKETRGQISADQVRFTFHARTSNDRTKVVAQVPVALPAGAEFQIDNLTDGGPSGWLPLVDGQAVELTLTQPGDNEFRVQAREGTRSMVLPDDRIVITKTAAPKITIPCAFCGSNYPVHLAACPACGMPPAAPTRALPVGTTLQDGRFAVGRVLGEGGFGITYKGVHKPLQRVVAIKELFPSDAQRQGTHVLVPQTRQLAYRQAMADALQEAQRIAQLQAPGIVEVFDTFPENGTVYIVMEYLEGQTLLERLQEQGPLPPTTVRTLALKICDALAVLHAQQLLHRDLKPENLMLTRDGRTVLIDFGSARPYQTDRTVQHTVILTVPYAAPEQYSERGRFGPYTDIFALGATLFHALTGAPPPRAIDRLQDPNLVPRLPGGVDPEWTVALDQALRLRVEDRPPTVAAFRQLLAGDGTGIVAPRCQYQLGAATTVGLNPGWICNEDSYGIAHNLEAYHDAQVQRLRACVADGMGSEEAGAVASQAAVDSFCHHPLPKRWKSPEEQAHWTRELGWKANEAVIAATGDTRGGCTLSGIVIEGNRLTLAHVGDSRIYLYSQEKDLRQLSRDHSYVQAMLDSGNMTEDEAAASSDTNPILRALGIAGRDRQNDGFVDSLSSRMDQAGNALYEQDWLTLSVGETVLLMSDGIWGSWEYRESVITRELTQVIEDESLDLDPQRIADALVKAALAEGADDNATVVVVKRTC